MLLEEMLRESIVRAEAHGNDKSFEIKDLFTGDEWNQLSAYEKRRLGQLFAKKVDCQEVPYIGRAPSGKNRHNRYKKNEVGLEYTIIQHKDLNN